MHMPDSTKNEKTSFQRLDLFISWVIGFLLLVMIFWGVYEKRLQNSIMYQTPEEQVHARERQFHQDIGAVRGELHSLSTQISDLKKSFAELQKVSGEATGKIDMMREYFQKYSPETFEKAVKRLDDRFDKMENEIDENYTKKTELEIVKRSYQHLPDKAEWTQFAKNLNEKLSLWDTVYMMLKNNPENKKIAEGVEKKKEEAKQKEDSKPVQVPPPGPS